MTQTTAHSWWVDLSYLDFTTIELLSADLLTARGFIKLLNVDFKPYYLSLSLKMSFVFFNSNLVCKIDG